MDRAIIVIGEEAAWGVENTQEWRQVTQYARWTNVWRPITNISGGTITNIRHAIRGFDTNVEERTDEIT